jgi:hypothetical protein
VNTWTLRTSGGRHVITASDANEHEWTAAFWSLFPTDEKRFVKLVRRDGIFVSVDLDFEPVTCIQPQYGGVEAERLARLLHPASARLDRLYGSADVTVDAAALDRFRADLLAWNDEYRNAVERCASRLPQPPHGCKWHSDSGGIMITHEAGGWPAPEWLTYRLWRNDLGYMPSSE